MAVCVFCSKEFTPCHNSKGTFCSKSCASKFRWSDKDYKNRLSGILKKSYENEDLRTRMSESTSNLWKDEEYREHMSEMSSTSVDRIPGLRELRSNLGKEYGFKNLNQISSSEDYWSKELDKLGIKYEAQKILSRGCGKSGFYKADFYLIDYNIDLEIDGSSHDIPGRLERDTVRDSALMEQGIKVIRMNSRPYGVKNTINDLKCILGL